jgi:hypothetical protein
MVVDILAPIIYISTTRHHCAFILFQALQHLQTLPFLFLLLMLLLPIRLRSKNPDYISNCCKQQTCVKLEFLAPMEMAMVAMVAMVAMESFIYKRAHRSRRGCCCCCCCCCCRRRCCCCWKFSWERIVIAMSSTAEKLSAGTITIVISSSVIMISSSSVSVITTSLSTCIIHVPTCFRTATAKTIKSNACYRVRAATQRVRETA